MLFNSLEFAVFLPITFLLYWFLAKKSTKGQNTIILVSSYVFYGFWDWRFLILIFFSSTLDYVIANKINHNKVQNKRKLLMWLSVFINIGLLGVFKYFNFFIDTFVQTFTLFGKNISASSLSLILPVGISFYTFQSLSYTIDVYRKTLKPTKDYISFLCYVSFFPQLVAGPIERASNLLPQFYSLRKFNYNQASSGLRQILWGLFKKMVVADNCARYVNIIFENSSDQTGSTLFLGAVLFSFQIYGDFSGYSDIAIGSAKLFGFDFKQNFSVPYFSRNIAEFWRRWHISLSTWFRDYLYIPLGGSRGSKLNTVRNIFIVFIISGFWHGANWTFIVWGFIHALFFVPSFLVKSNRRYLDVVAKNSFIPSFKEILSMLFTFIVVTLAWVFFRAETVMDAFVYFQNMFSKTMFTMPYYISEEKLIVSIFFIIVLIVFEWIGRKNSFTLEHINVVMSRPIRYVFYYGLIMVIFLFGAKNEPFIYFQF